MGLKFTRNGGFDVGGWEMHFEQFPADSDALARNQVLGKMSRGGWCENPPPQLFQVKEVPLKTT